MGAVGLWAGLSAGLVVVAIVLVVYWWRLPIEKLTQLPSKIR